MSSKDTHRLRIDFVVREVCDDGSLPEDSLRFIKFGDDVSIGDVKDFFDRCGHAMGLMFGQGKVVLSFVSVGPNKINAIKIVRELGCYGLKEAKDIVEGPMGTPIVVVEDSRDIRHAIDKLHECGCTVEARSAAFPIKTMPGFPPVAVFKRYP